MQSYNLVWSLFKRRVMRTTRQEGGRNSAKENKAKTNKYGSREYGREGGSNERQRASYVLIK